MEQYGCSELEAASRVADDEALLKQVTGGLPPGMMKRVDEEWVNRVAAQLTSRPLGMLKRGNMTS